MDKVTTDDKGVTIRDIPYDKILNSVTIMPITEIAADYGMSAQKMNHILCDLKIQHKTTQGVYLLYSKYAGYGYTKTKTHPYIDNAGVSRTKTYTCWTQKGRLFLYDLLKSVNILPLIERSED